MFDSKLYEKSEWLALGKEDGIPKDFYPEDANSKPNSPKSAFRSFVSNDKEDILCEDKSTLHDKNNYIPNEADIALKGSIAYIKEWVGYKMPDGHNKGVCFVFCVTTYNDKFEYINQYGKNYTAFGKILKSMISDVFIPANKSIIFNIYVDYLYKMQKERGDSN